MTGFFRLCLIGAVVLAPGCRDAGPQPLAGAGNGAGETPPAEERQIPAQQRAPGQRPAPAEAVPADAAPLTDAEPQADAEPPADAEAQADAEPPADAEPAISRERALAVARRQVLFEPETELAELASDDEPSVWRVTLRGRRPGGSLFAFETATVTVDARTGDVLGVESR